MRREGNRNFGVWNPPTGMDAIRQSERVNFELVAKLNSLQFSKEMGIRQAFGKDLERFETPDTKSINIFNNNLKVFHGMTQQGWGG